VCPRAPVTCANGGSAWSSGSSAELVEASIERLQARFPGRVAADHRTLIGFSLGAFVAADLIQRAAQRWDQALLIAAKAPLDAGRIARGTTKRVLFAAGDYDASFEHLSAAARRLSRAGLDVRFQSLGKVGHRFAPDMDAWLEDALDWLLRPEK
jgi:predicted esterase